MKTRIMNAKKGAGVQYKNVFDCFIQTFKNEVKFFLKLSIFFF